MQEWLARWKLRRCASLGAHPIVHGEVWIRGEGRVHIGDRVVLDGDPVGVELFAHEGAELVLGDDVRIGPGASIEATCSVVVGDGAELGAMSKVMDSHFHPLDGDRHRRTEGTPLVLGAHVHVGARAVVLPGGDLDDEAIVAPGCVIGRHVPDHALAIGLPAKVIRATVGREEERP